MLSIIMSVTCFWRGQFYWIVPRAIFFVQDDDDLLPHFLQVICVGKSDKSLLFVSIMSEPLQTGFYESVSAVIYEQNLERSN
jgi:hypothetical protein